MWIPTQKSFVLNLTECWEIWQARLTQNRVKIWSGFNTRVVTRHRMNRVRVVLYDRKAWITCGAIYWVMRRYGQSMLEHSSCDQSSPILDFISSIQMGYAIEWLQERKRVCYGIVRRLQQWVLFVVEYFFSPNFARMATRTLSLPVQPW